MSLFIGIYNYLPILTTTSINVKLMGFILSNSELKIALHYVGKKLINNNYGFILGDYII